MKTAVTLPDALAHAADLFAAQNDMSRSELCAKTLAEYLERHSYDNLTEEINAAMENLNASGDMAGESCVSAIRNLEW